MSAENIFPTTPYSELPPNEQEQFTCRCGHMKTAHYRFVRNGEMADMCMECDPTTAWPSGDYDITAEVAEKVKAA